MINVQVTERVVDHALVIEVSGRLDSTTAATLEAVLLPGLEASEMVILDMTKVVYVSSAGLRVLLRAAKLARNFSHGLRLAGLAPQVSEVLEISGCASLFSIHPDLSSAMLPIDPQG